MVLTLKAVRSDITVNAKPKVDSEKDHKQGPGKRKQIQEML